MFCLFSDLDGTLIYSKRIVPDCETVVAERIDGQLQSWMTKYTFSFFESHPEILLVPLTMRSEVQYQRLSGIMARLGCTDALVCCGGILLHKGMPDPVWTEETMSIIREELPMLFEAERYLEKRVPVEKIHRCSGVMLYASVDFPDLFAEEMKRLLPSKGLTIYRDRRKIYVLPSSLQKGNAAKRYMKYKGIRRCAAAGDREPDLTMLETADTAILPEVLSNRLRNPEHLIVGENIHFSDFICDVLPGLYQKYKNTP